MWSCVRRDDSPWLSPTAKLGPETAVKYMLVAILAHFAVALLLPAIAQRWGRAAFIVGAVLSAATLATLLLFFSDGAFGDNDDVVEQTLRWAPAIDLEITFRIDALSVLMALLVSGVGALVLTYYACYAKPGDPIIGRDRKSTRLNSSHVKISYAVFCLKTKR